MSKRHEPKVEPINVNLPDNAVGDNVRRLRERKDITQDQLSIKLETLGVHICRTSVVDIEKRRRRVTDRELYALSRILGVPMEELIDQEEREKMG